MFLKIRNARRLIERLIRRIPRKKMALTFVVLFIALAFLEQAPPSQLYETQPGFYRVVQVHDGDTIEVEKAGRNEKVRLIGVDTPETIHPDKPVQCFGVQAAQFARAQIDKSDNQVKLVADGLNDNRDRYDRLVRYVYLSNGSLLNAQILKQGYGFSYQVFPYKKSSKFKEYEDSARTKSRGLWSKCDVTNDFVKETVWQ